MTDNGVLRALPYLLWPAALILLLIEETKDKKDKDIRHHAYNALGFVAMAFLLSIPLWIISWVPFIGAVAVFMYWIVIIIFAIICAVKAYRNEKVNIPFATDFLKKNVKNF